MPFSNLETIRKHLAVSEVTQATYRDVTVRLEGTLKAALLHHNLLSDSIVVKGKEIGAPDFVQQTLGAAPQFLGKQQLIPDSVAVASDTSLGIIYAENLDYQVDYEAGNITRLESGAIPGDAHLAIWFYAFTIYEPGSDYFVDADAGTLRRATGSNIEDGQMVFVDYKTLPSSFGDTQIENAILEAYDRLKQWLAPEYYHSADQSLISAETYLTLAILYRVRAAATLQNNTLSQSASVAKEWLDLAESYEAQALRLVSAYAQPRATLTSPIATSARSKP